MAKKKNVTTMPIAPGLAANAEPEKKLFKVRATHVPREVRVDLTVQEMKTLGNALAQAVGRLNESENDKAEKISRFNAGIKAHRAQIDKIAQQVNLGYEMRLLKCPISYNDPQVGQKTIQHPQTLQPLSVEAMTEDERQENLFREEDPEKAGEKAKENLAKFKGKGKNGTTEKAADAGTEFDTAKIDTAADKKDPVN